MGLRLRRFKTGTPPRVNARSVRFDEMQLQPGDEEIEPFSYSTDAAALQNRAVCWLTYTNPRTHGIIRANLDRSPLFNGTIESTGPRYCPSIETKIVTFPDKERHQLFIEPMGLHTQELYIQGLSSSLPEDVQIDVVRSIPGLENAEMQRCAYAIEYDCVDPTELRATLESKRSPVCTARASSTARPATVQDKYAAVAKERQRLEHTHLAPGEAINALLREKGTAEIVSGASLADLLRRPQIEYADLLPFDPERPALPRARRRGGIHHAQIRGLYPPPAQAGGGFPAHGGSAPPRGYRLCRRSGAPHRGAAEARRHTPRELRAGLAHFRRISGGYDRAYDLHRERKGAPPWIRSFSVSPAAWIPPWPRTCCANPDWRFTGCISITVSRRGRRA